MSVKKSVLAFAASVLLIAAGSLPTAAQYAPPECTDLYNRSMAAYQSAGDRR